MNLWCRGWEQRLTSFPVTVSLFVASRERLHELAADEN